MTTKSNGLWPVFQKEVIKKATATSLIKQDIVKTIRMPAGTTATTLLSASKVSLGTISLVIFHMIDADGNKYACFVSLEELRSLSDLCLTILKDMELEEPSVSTRQ